MRETPALGPWIRRFLLEHLVSERNLAANTRSSYRDTLCQLLPFVSARLHKAVDRLDVVDMSAQVVREFLGNVETGRGCGIATRNQRLGAIHALARFIGEHSPEHISWCAQVRCVPYKKGTHAAVPYLNKAEIDALLATPDRRTPQGRRDYALLLFLYNTGARASEASDLTIGDLHLDHASVDILGKGRKRRQCPLWPATVRELRALVNDRPPKEQVFLNRCGEPMTRHGVHALVERTAARAQEAMPSLATKRVSPHCIRHSTATHLLSSGVEINTVRAWLGHASLETTNVYAEIDLEGKTRALAKCEVTAGQARSKQWRTDRNIMQFLRSL
ncbi:tyrosine-type recombinase/integrase [Variovorax rhizosphaerae]|uniref:Tyrosine-type recombinase/integrase n=1 Tax=Variovorax rhizosphaerae TaxID=1836200 RepID=A0ABU8WYS0_9BURK